MYLLFSIHQGNPIERLHPIDLSQKSDNNRYWLRWREIGTNVTGNIKWKLMFSSVTVDKIWPRGRTANSWFQIIIRKYARRIL